MSEVRRRPIHKPGRKPSVRYDFSQGYIHENLPPEAVRAMRVAGIGTNRMEQELRNYYRHRGIEEIRPVRVLQIVSRYVDVYPISFVEMEQALGRRAARETMRAVPHYTWNVQDFLDYIDIRLGHRHRQDVNFLIENSVGADMGAFVDVSKRHLTRAGYALADVMRHHRAQVDRTRAVVRT